MLAKRGSLRLSLGGFRALSSSSVLSFDKYPFLRELGLEEDNLGVYNGQWFGNGPVLTSVNPASGQPIARVTSGSMADYDACVKQMNSAKKFWANTPAPKRSRLGHLV